MVYSASCTYNTVILSMHCTGGMIPFWEACASECILKVGEHRVSQATVGSEVVAESSLPTDAKADFVLFHRRPQRNQYRSYICEGTVSLLPALFKFQIENARNAPDVGHLNS